MSKSFVKGLCERDPYDASASCTYSDSLEKHSFRSKVFRSHGAQNPLLVYARTLRIARDSRLSRHTKTLVGGLGSR